MKKLIIIFIIAVIGLTVKSYGQGICNDAITLYPTDTVFDIPANATETWYIYYANTPNLLIEPVLTADTAYKNITGIQLYTGACGNLTLIDSSIITHRSGLYIDSLSIGNTYYIKITKLLLSPLVSFKKLDRPAHPICFDPTCHEGSPYPVSPGYGTCDLVCNGNFEYYTSIPNCISQIGLACPWSSVSDATPDYFNELAPPPDPYVPGFNPWECYVQVPDNCIGYIYSYNANLYPAGSPQHHKAYAGIALSVKQNDYREYIFQGLKHPLIKGVTYTVTLKVSTAYSTSSVNNLGVYFCNSNPYIGTGTLYNNCSPISYVPSQTWIWREHRTGYITNSMMQWVDITYNYTPAVNGLQYIVIGAFGTAGQSDYNENAYYFIDEVHVTASQQNFTILADHNPVCLGNPVTLTTNTNLPVNWSCSPSCSMSSNSNCISTIATPTEQTSFTAYLTYAPGCTLSATTTVGTIPIIATITAASVSDPCQNSIAKYTTETGMTNYSWNVTGGNIVSGLGSNIIRVQWNTTGIQTINVSYTNNGCLVTGTFEVNVLESPPPITIIGNPNNCDLTATYTIDNLGTNYTYSWAITTTNTDPTGSITDGQGTPTITVNWNNQINNMHPGILTAVVIDPGNGCPSSSTMNIYDCCAKSHPENPAIHHAPYYEVNSSADLPSGNFTIDGVVKINYNITLNQQLISFGPYAQITVSPDVTFTVDNASFLGAGCDFMWDGVYVSDPTAEVIVTGNSSIQSAINGIVSENGGKFTLRDVNMNYNLYSVRVRNYADQTPHTGSIKNTLFNGATSLLPPYAGQKTFCGVESSWILGVLNIGDETDVPNLNIFQNMRYGVYATNSNINVVNNKFLNIENGLYSFPPIQVQKNYPEGAVYATNSWPWFTLDIFGHSFTFTPAFDVKVGGYGLKRNYFDNCKTGVYTYKNLSTIENNNFKNCGNGIRSVDVADKSKYTNNTIYGDHGNVVTPGYGIDLRNVFSNPKGIGCLVDSNDITNKYYGISLINISGDKTLRFADVNSNKIWFNVTAPTPVGIIHTGIWAQNSNFSQIKYNRIERNVHAFAGLEDNNVLGIRIADCIEAKVMQNQINRMGSGILGHGGLTNTMFGCNSFFDNYYGLNFDWSASVSAQGAAGVYNPDNGWYDGTQNGFLRIKKVFGPLDYYYDPTVMNAYDPSPYPFWGGIIVHQNTGVATLCVANPGSTGTGGNTGYELPNFDVTARETAFGSIVRGEKLYAMLEEEYRQKDREYVYEMLRKYPEWINMGGEDDNVYFAFYNEMYQTDIEKVLKMREEMYAQNIELAKQKLEQVADDNTINTNRKIAGSIYLDTWGSYKYELNDEQVDALSKIAYLTPYAGGDAVYTARVMLDINPDEIAGLDYAKPPVHYPVQAKELNAVVFPNPAKDKITVKFTETIAADGIIEFYGMMGNLVYTSAITKGVAEMQINVNSVKSGLYFYTVKVNDTKITSGKITIVNK